MNKSIKKDIFTLVLYVLTIIIPVFLLVISNVLKIFEIDLNRNTGMLIIYPFIFFVIFLNIS